MCPRLLSQQFLARGQALIVLLTAKTIVESESFLGQQNPVSRASKYFTRDLAGPDPKICRIHSKTCFVSYSILPFKENLGE